VVVEKNVRKPERFFDHLFKADILILADYAAI
jgi:hypothetical protein